MRRVAIACLVLLAGCSGLSSQPGATLTPAPVPTETQSPTPVPRLAPGLTAAGVVDPLALTTAHYSRLRGESYTRTRTVTIWSQNGSLRRRERTVRRVGASGSRMLIEHDIEGPAVRDDAPTHVETWRNRSRILLAVGESPPTYASRSSSTFGQGLYGVSSPIQSSQELFVVLLALDARVVDTDPPYRVTATEVARPGQFENATVGEDPRNVSFETRVAPDGFVLERRLTYEATLDRDRVRVERVVRYADVGGTTVERPPWYEAAVNATGGR